MGVSLKPSAQSEFAGLDGPHMVTSARFQEFAYRNKEGQSQGTSVGLMLKAVSQSGDEREQFYSVGPTDRWIPSDDGTEINSASGDNSRGPSKNSTFSIFMAELDNAGFSVEEEIEESIAEIEGIIIDFVAKTVSKVSGGDRTIPVPGSVLAGPDEKNDWRKKFASSGSSKGTSGSRRAKKKTSKKKTTARRNGEDDSDAAETAALKYLTALGEEYEAVGLDDLVDLVNKKARRDDLKEDIIELIADEDFLTSHEDVFKFKDDVVTFQ